MRRIVSLWLPHFTTERLIRIRPDWRDKPFAAVLAGAGRREILAVSRAARRSGIIPGMTLADARAMLPSLIAADADPAADRRALAALAEWCGRYAPWIASDGASLAGGGAGLLLDATGCAHLFGGEAAMLDLMVTRVSRLGLTVRAAMAATPGAARALARWGTGRIATIAAEDETAAALAPLPAAALGLSPVTAASLSALGLRTVGQLYGLPRAAMAARFGAAVMAPLDCALGRIFEPISPDKPPPRHAVRMSFAEPVARIEDIAAALDRLLAALCHGLARENEGARRLRLSLYEPDGRTRQAHLGLAAASRDAAHMARLFAARLDGIDAAFGFDAMCLAATETDTLAPQQIAKTPAETAPATMPAALVDALSNRLGEANVLRCEARESRIPERAAVLIPAVAPLKGNAAPFAPPGAPARPLRLLARPEPVEVMMALLPHDPPAVFRWRRVAHRVARAEGPERIAPEWWREAETCDATTGPSRGERDYWRLEDERGHRFWLYRLGLGWYLHGIYG